MNKHIISAIMLMTSIELSAKNHIEINGSVIIEAENFAAQHNDDKRRWLIFTSTTEPHKLADSDPLHIKGASENSYIELLPDTRTNHNDPIVRGENFTSVAGAMAVLSYPVYFTTAGTYYVWARAYSTNSEDNGIHVGINGSWPESSKRLQLCKNKHQWTWSSAQRTKENHCGVPNTITLEVPFAGVHNIMVSMREDGFELDKILLTTNKDYQPSGVEAPETLSIQSN